MITTRRLIELLKAASNGNVFGAEPKDDEYDLIEALEKFVARQAYERDRDHSQD